MTTRQWQNITDYMDTVGTTLKTFTFPKTQNYVNVTIRGNANVSYTIGSQSGTLSPGQSVSVSEKITSFTLTAVSGTQTVEVWATEDGTQKVEDDSSDSIAGLASSLASKAQQTDLATITQLSDVPTNIDDTATLQAKLNSLSSGDTLTLRDGTYYITSLSFTKNNVKIKGRNTVIKYIGPLTATPMVSFGGTNLKIKNITFDLNNKACYGAVITSGSENVRFNNCTIQNGYNDGTINSKVVGLYIQDNSKRIYVNDCVIQNMVATPNGTTGDSIGASRAILVNEYNSTNLSSNVYITNCKIDNIQPVEDGDAIQVTSQTSTIFTKVVIEKCIFTNCAKRFVKSNVMGTIIRDNEMINSSPSTDAATRTDSMFSAISIYNSFIDVIDNNIHGNGFYSAIDMDLGATTLLDSVRILNNRISVSENGAVVTNQGAIQIFAQARNIIIKDNKITKGQDNIYIHGDIDGFIITGNILLGASTAGIFLDSFNTTNAVNYLFTSNIIKSTNNAIISKYGTGLAAGNALSSTGGFGAFGSQNNNGLTRSANTGLGAFGTNIGYGTSLPSLRSTTFDYGHEGALFVVSTAGQLDKLYVCVKDATDVYSWKQIAFS